MFTYVIIIHHYKLISHLLKNIFLSTILRKKETICMVPINFNCGYFTSKVKKNSKKWLSINESRQENITEGKNEITIFDRLVIP